jgi:acid phosphatase (class A)
MTYKHYFVIFFLSITFVSFGQEKAFDRPLTSARGHYKQLSAFSPKPASAAEEIDRQKFATDRETVELRMSRTPYYLVGVRLSDFQIPDPPANSSEQTRAEINYLLALQERRTDEDIRSSLYMANIYYSLSVKPEDSTYAAFRRNLFHIGRSIGTWFNPENMPVTADLIANTWRDASYFIWSMKFKYARIRPYVIEPDLNNLQETDWAAYPSGHASNSYINAYIYQELAPEFTDVFLKDAYDMAHSREILGVHYPSDSESARIFARQFVNKLFQNERFLKDFALARKEWAEKAKENFSSPMMKATGSNGSPGGQDVSCAKKCD